LGSKVFGFSGDGDAGEDAGVRVLCCSFVEEMTIFNVRKREAREAEKSGAVLFNEAMHEFLFAERLTDEDDEELEYFRRSAEQGHAEA
jgi:hypothetical protein